VFAANTRSRDDNRRGDARSGSLFALDKAIHGFSGADSSDEFGEQRPASRAARSDLKSLIDEMSSFITHAACHRARIRGEFEKVIFAPEQSNGGKLPSNDFTAATDI